MGAALTLALVTERLLTALPPAAHPAVAQTVGTLAYLAASRARAAVRANLEVIDPQHRASARAVFVSQVRQYLEVFSIPRLDYAKFEASIRVEGWDNFVCAHERGKGVILASAHLGPIALVGQVLITRGYELTLPVETADSELMRAVNRARGAQGMRLIPIESPLGISRVLRRGGVLGVLADRPVSRVGERVPFFGREALLPSAHVALALRAGAAVLPSFTWRERGLLCARILEPLDLAETGDRDADVREGVGRFAAILETYVRRFPEQWSVFEPVWGGA